MTALRTPCVVDTNVATTANGAFGASRLTDAPAVGLYVRRDGGERLLMRAKLVQPSFVQAIDEHWTRRGLTANRIAREYHA